jgi:hypothetical protein
MKVRLPALLPLLFASFSLAQLPYTELQVIEYAKSIDVKTLDPSLPSQRLEDWLQNEPPRAHVYWRVADTCDLKPDDSAMDYPLCAKITLSRNGENGEFLVQVGTTRSGIVGHPKLYYGVGVWEGSNISTGGSDRLSDLPAFLDQPVVTGEVKKLYEEIVNHYPVGIPTSAEMAAIRPFLSKRLAELLDSAQACEVDYLGQHHSRDDAAEPVWLKAGIFSGVGRHASPTDWWIAGKEAQKDGSFLVFVSLQLYERSKPGHAPPESDHFTSLVWPVAAKVFAEDGRFVVDDVRIFDHFPPEGPSQLLSDSFAGCDGPHWTGLVGTSK